MSENLSNLIQFTGATTARSDVVPANTVQIQEKGRVALGGTVVCTM